jgi:hypothetical protein
MRGKRSLKVSLGRLVWVLVEVGLSISILCDGSVAHNDCFGCVRCRGLEGYEHSSRNAQVEPPSSSSGYQGESFPCHSTWFDLDRI